jgi:hypothetical protein
MIIIICAAHKNHRPAAGALTFENFFFLCIICAALENHRLACAAERDSNDAHVGTPKCCRGFFFLIVFVEVLLSCACWHTQMYMYNMYIYVCTICIYMCTICIYIYIYMYSAVLKELHVRTLLVDTYLNQNRNLPKPT